MAANSLLSKYQDEAHACQIVLAFDEAHVLHQPISDGSSAQLNPPTHFSELRRVLRSLKHQRVFSLFLSTSGKIHSFTPPAGPDPSARQSSYFSLHSPYTELGFDQMMDDVVLKDQTIETVSTPNFMAKFGRPL